MTDRKPQRIIPTTTQFTRSTADGTHPLAASQNDFDVDSVLDASAGNATPSAGQSLFARRLRQQQNTPGNDPALETTSKPQFPSHINSTDVLFGSVLSNVRERTEEPESNGHTAVLHPQPPVGGFPAASHRSAPNNHIQSLRESRLTQDVGRTKNATQKAAFNSLLAASSTAEAVDDDIHGQNVAEIAKMSSTGINNALEEITSKLSSSAIDFLIAKAKKRYDNASESNANGESSQKEYVPDVLADNVGKVPEPVQNDDMAILNAIRANDPAIQPVKFTPKLAAHEAKQRGYPNNSVVDSNIQPRNKHIISEFDRALSEGKLVNTADWIPKDELEADKLEWIQGGLVETNNTTNDVPNDVSTLVKSLRFDLNGDIVLNSSSIGAYEGLHHHGDDPDQAGYRIDEIERLLRSTAHMQRILAIDVLKKIINKAFCNYYDSKDELSVFGNGSREKLELSARIFQLLYQRNVLLTLRICLDDVHNQVIIAALECILAYMGLDDTAAEHLNDFDGRQRIHSVFDRFSTISKCNRQFGISNRNTRFYQHRAAFFGSTPTSLEDELQEGAESVTNQRSTVLMRLADDYIGGLLSTSLVDRLNYLMDSPFSKNKSAQLLIVKILYGISISSKVFAQTYIAECPGLINLLVKNALHIQWPHIGPDIQLVTDLACFTLRVLRNIALCSRQMAIGLIDLNVVDVIARFLFCGIFSTEEMLQKPSEHLVRECTAMIQCCSLRVLQVFIDYGLAGPQLIDMYRLPLYEYCKDIFNADMLITSQNDNNTQNGALVHLIRQTQASFLSFIASVIESFGSQLHIGDATDDALEPIFLVILEKKRFESFFSDFYSIQTDYAFEGRVLLSLSVLACMRQYMRFVNMMEHRSSLHGIAPPRGKHVLTSKVIGIIDAAIQSSDVVQRLLNDDNNAIYKYLKKIKNEMVSDLKEYIWKVVFVAGHKDVSAKMKANGVESTDFLLSAGTHFTLLNNISAVKLASTLVRYSSVCQLFIEALSLISESHSHTATLKKKQDDSLWKQAIENFPKFISTLTPVLFITPERSTAQYPCVSQYSSLAIRQFAPNYARLLYTIVEELPSLPEDSVFGKDTRHLSYLLAVTAFGNMTTGDEYFASKAFYKNVAYLVSPDLFPNMASDATLSEDERLRSLFDVRDQIENRLYDEDTVVESGKYFARQTGYPTSMYLQLGGLVQHKVDVVTESGESKSEQITKPRRTLPAARCWPLILTILLRPKQVSPESPLSYLDYNTGLRVLCESFNFVKVHYKTRLQFLERHQSVRNMLDSVLFRFYRDDVLAFGMHAFMGSGQIAKTPANDKPDSFKIDVFFRNSNVEPLLKFVLEEYKDDPNCDRKTLLENTDIDLAMGEEGRFYSLYNDLLEQYESVSFGNKVFLDYLTLPLRGNSYPKDYKSEFVIKLSDLFPSFNSEITSLIS